MPEPKWKLFKEGKVVDMDYVCKGDHTYVQLKFEDGKIMLLYHSKGSNLDKIRIGQKIKMEENTKRREGEFKYEKWWR